MEAEKSRISWMNNDPIVSVRKNERNRMILTSLDPYKRIM